MGATSTHTLIHGLAAEATGNHQGTITAPLVSIGHHPDGEFLAHQLTVKTVPDGGPSTVRVPDPRSQLSALV